MALPEDLRAALTFDADGLITAVAQQRDTGEVLMVAHMNEAALTETLASGNVTYWSRSRQKLWRKGETSGQTQRLLEARVDCDGDAVVLLVEQTGVACHTGRHSCFYRRLTSSGLDEILPVEAKPDELYG